MKANQISTKTVSAADAASLDAAIATFLQGLGEAEFLSIQFIVDGATLYALIAYVT